MIARLPTTILLSSLEVTSVLVWSIYVKYEYVPYLYECEYFLYLYENEHEYEYEYEDTRTRTCSLLDLYFVLVPVVIESWRREKKKNINIFNLIELVGMVPLVTDSTSLESVLCPLPYYPLFYFPTNQSSRKPDMGAVPDHWRWMTVNKWMLNVCITFSHSLFFNLFAS